MQRGKVWEARGRKGWGGEGKKREVRKGKEEMEMEAH